MIKKKHLNVFTFLFFLFFFIYGFNNVKNYGVAYDEGGHRLVAIVNLNHIGKSLLNEKTYSEFLEKRNYPTEKIDRLKKKEYEIDNFHNNFYGAIYPIFLFIMSNFSLYSFIVLRYEMGICPTSKLQKRARNYHVAFDKPFIKKNYQTVKFSYFLYYFGSL